MSKYKWNLEEKNKEVAVIPDFFKKENISDALARIMIRRGINSEDILIPFLHGSLNELENPFVMKGMKSAVDRILIAINKNENIVIFGDYDVDGITSTSILYRFFKNLGVNVGYYIPDRETEGYGPNVNAINNLAKKYDLLITVDCGIAAAKIFKEASKDIDVIVTDHHMPPDELPDVISVIDPHQKDCEYHFSEMAGCGVAYSLCRAIYLKKFNKDYFNDIELVALGTIADVVSLTDENRIFVKEGLKRLINTENKGLKALLYETGILKENEENQKKMIRSENISFIIAPRLNAAGRINHAKIGVELFTSTNDCKAKELAKKLCEINSERQKIEREIYGYAQDIVKKKDLSKEKTIVIAGENWHPGVIGIVASRLLDTYNKPSFVISIKDGVGKGSCRSIPGFNIYEALKAHSDILLQFGGHKMAAGFSIKEENIKLFEERMIKYTNEKITDEDCIPILEIEENISLNEITLDFIRSLDILEPFGCDNPKPLFLSKEILVNKTRRIGNENKHFKFSTFNNKEEIEGVFWNYENNSFCNQGQLIDVVYEPEIHNWYGEHVQLNCKDIEISYESTLNRDILVKIYNSLRKCNIRDLNENKLVEFIFEDVNYSINKIIIKLGLKVFVELGILSIFYKKYELFYKFNFFNKKFNLEDSETYKKYNNC